MQAIKAIVKDAGGKLDADADYDDITDSHNVNMDSVIDNAMRPERWP